MNYNIIKTIDIVNIEKNLSVENFSILINALKTIDKKDYPYFFKWKNYQHQIVFQTKNYFYKIYQIEKITEFFSIIRNQLGKIYRNDYGIDWNIFTIEQNGIIYQIQQREKLKVLTEKDIQLTEIFKEWKKTLLKLENTLNLNLIKKQLNIHKELKDIFYLKLIRQCCLKYKDYAIKNNNIILLDDTDWFLALANKNKELLLKKSNTYEINLYNRNYIFAPLNIKWDNRQFKLENRTYKWFLYSIEFLQKNKPNLTFYNNQYKTILKSINDLC